MNLGYSVIQYFRNGFYEKVKENLGPEEAVDTAEHCCKSVAAQSGITRRVMITDPDDFCCFLWEYGSGVLYPTREEIEGAHHGS